MLECVLSDRPHDTTHPIPKTHYKYIVNAHKHTYTHTHILTTKHPILHIRSIPHGDEVYVMPAARPGAVLTWGTSNIPCCVKAHTWESLRILGWGGRAVNMNINKRRESICICIREKCNFTFIMLLNNARNDHNRHSKKSQSV